MKLRNILSALAVTALLAQSCSNDFELTSEWKEIPVVYAMLNPQASAQFVRIEKAFLDPNTSALTVAKIADSLYYREGEISVFLQRKGNAQLVPLQRVDGNLEGFIRDTGIFATTPNWLYKVNSAAIPGGIVENQTYSLIIKRANGGPDITAETIVPRRFNIIAPSLTNTPRVVNFFGTPTSFQWTHDENAVLFNIILKIPYREIGANNAIVHRDTMIWTAISNQEIGDNFVGNTNVLVPARNFYDALANHVKTPNDGRRRVFGTTIELIIEGGGREIRNFKLTADANAGLTGAEIIQTYSNLSEGYGIFTAKNVQKEGDFRIPERTLDSLAAYPPTRDLNFKLQ